MDTAVAFGKVVLDTPDPRGLAAFYAHLLGWEVDPDDDDEWVTIRGAGAAPLAFQRAEDLVVTTWPAAGIPQQFHLDFDVDSYEGPEARAIALGATLVDASEDHADFRVYTDPSGHPFCLCLRN
ncbi:MAG: VOC family protein, partial [Janthinobacterium lividum]